MGLLQWWTAGSRGADNVDELVKVVQSAPNRVRILLNISRGGLSGGNELLDLSKADPGAARSAIERHREWVIGIKARLSRSAAGENDLEALRRARMAADPLKVPISPRRQYGITPAGDSCVAAAGRYCDPHVRSGAAWNAGREWTGVD